MAMGDKENALARIPAETASNKIVDLPEGVRKGGDLLNPAKPEASPESWIDAPAASAEPSAGGEAPSSATADQSK